MKSLHPPVDSAFADKYRIERTIGTGAMGVVVAARHVRLGQRVAIKYLVDDALDYPELIERFTREGRAIATIRSEHVARVHDIGSLSNGLPYMVLEYLEGEDLETYMNERGPLPVAEAVRYVLETCEALAEAHAAKIVHRDLKPANIFIAVQPDGRRIAKLIDFGVSKLLDEPMTKTAILVGTALYMSPEHLRSSRGVDARTDIWALGVVLYEILAGEPPFVGHSVAELARELATGVFPSLRSKRPDVPQGLSDVVANCLRTDRDERYASALDLAAALEPFADPADRVSVANIRHFLQGSSAPPPPASAPVPRPALELVTTTERPDRAPASGAKRFVLAAFVLLLVLAMGVLAAFRLGLVHLG